ncbi:MAG: OmpH family outer membrane protein [Chitinophagaceae bacterium]|nr:OmpH family outer membrane protein [Chitinophagaceae bacterium]MCW5905544.1 OmpH family outer membrane protein [Chitinophagaceae bacterium]
MKNFTTILTIVLAIAVAVLFYLHFSTKTASSIINNSSNDSTASNSNFKIAYFEMDSLENQYEYLKDVRNSLRALEQKKGNELNQLRNAGHAKILEYQKRGNSMTEQEIAQANEELMKMDNELKTQEQIKAQELQDESIKKIQEVKKTIEDFLKEYNEDKNFSYILSSSADIIYLKDTAYDITKDLIQGLNETYKKKKKP